MLQARLKGPLRIETFLYFDENITKITNNEIWENLWTPIVFYRRESCCRWRSIERVINLYTREENLNVRNFERWKKFIFLAKGELKVRRAEGKWIFFIDSLFLKFFIFSVERCWKNFMSTIYFSQKKKKMGWKGRMRIYFTRRKLYVHQMSSESGRKKYT